MQGVRRSTHEEDRELDSNSHADSPDEIDIENCSQPLENNNTDEASPHLEDTSNDTGEKSAPVEVQTTSTVNQRVITRNDTQNKSGGQVKRQFISPKKRASVTKRPPKGSTTEAVQNTVSMASEALATMKNILVKKESANERDEFTVFGEHVALKLRKLTSNRVRSIVQHKINNLIFEAEMGNSEYSYNDFSSNSSPSLLGRSNTYWYNANPYPSTVSRTYSEPCPRSISVESDNILGSRNLNFPPNSPSFSNFSVPNSPAPSNWSEQSSHSDDTTLNWGSVLSPEDDFLSNAKN